MKKQQQRSARRSRFYFDPKLVQISPEEIRADLHYPAGERRRARRP